MISQVNPVLENFSTINYIPEITIQNKLKRLQVEDNIIAYLIEKAFQSAPFFDHKLRKLTNVKLSKCFKMIYNETPGDFLA